jgi:hypothetical protein
MRRHAVEIVLAAACTALFAAVAVWQTPGTRAKLTTAEIDGYVARLEASVPMEAGEKAEFLAHLRAWGQADDGQPVYMLNLMRFHDRLQPVPGHPELAGTPEEANTRYEDAVIPMLLRLGAYPSLMSEPQGVRTGAASSTNLIGYEPDIDDWSRVLVVRYPSRRAFVDLISDPAYLQVMPNKIASMKLVLVPLYSEGVIPDLRWFVGGILLAVFLLVGWVRAARHR